MTKDGERDIDAGLDVVILGGSIGGLAAAIELQSQGHRVTVYDQRPHGTDEPGMVVLLAPSANSALARLGIDLTEDDGIPTRRICEGGRDSSSIKETAVDSKRAERQYGWISCRCSTLHRRLKQKALAVGKSNDGGPQVRLVTDARVVHVTPDGLVMLDNREQQKAHVVIGADGVHSIVREAVCPGTETYSSGRNAYSFLIRRDEIEQKCPKIFELMKQNGTLVHWSDSDRHICCFPVDNEWLSMVCTHPEELYDTSNNGWRQKGDKERLLDIYEDFADLRELLGLAPDSGLGSWKLIDLELLPHWTRGNLAMLGNATQSLSPYLGGGGGAAIEDAMSLSAMLPPGTDPEEVPARLRLYEKARVERVHALQDSSRQAGLDLSSGSKGCIGTIMADIATLEGAHDERRHSAQILKGYMEAKATGDFIWRSPVGFGPAPGPRQSFPGAPPPVPDAVSSPFRSAAIRFRTSRLMLQELLPRRDVLTFDAPGLVAEATWKFQRNGSVGWLGGRPYSHLSLYLHGVRVARADGTALVGDFLLLMLEDRADPVVTGRDELGFPKLACDLHSSEWFSAGVDGGGSGGGGDIGDLRIVASWDGHDFATLEVARAAPAGQGNEQSSSSPPPSTPPRRPSDGTLVHRYVPAVGKRDEVDADYIVCVPPPPSSDQGADTPMQRNRRWTSSEAAITLDAGDWQRLPLLHHIVRRLAELPVLNVVQATVVQGTGVSNHSSAYRVF